MGEIEVLQLPHTEIHIESDEAYGRRVSALLEKDGDVS